MAMSKRKKEALLAVKAAKKADLELQLLILSVLSTIPTIKFFLMNNRVKCSHASWLDCGQKYPIGKATHEAVHKLVELGIFSKDEDGVIDDLYTRGPGSMITPSILKDLKEYPGALRMMPRAYRWFLNEGYILTSINECKESEDWDQDMYEITLSKVGTIIRL